jgi:GTP-binding protein HflX
LKAILFANEEFEDEVVALAESALYEIAKVYPLPRKPNPVFYLQKDKLEQIKNDDSIEAIIIFDLVKSRQFIGLYREIPSKKVLDKVLLLLEIFALHAGSKEAKLQIELAKLRYELPIIKDMYKKTKITEQQGPLGAGVYGVEAAIRLYLRRIVKIRQELEQLRKVKEEQIKKNDFKKIAIVGYTNAGKTTLFNALTGLRQKVDSSMFTTTSPKRYSIPIKLDGKKEKVMLIDTVGFIRGIPPQIVEAFFVTLSEAKYADILVLVLDASINDSMLIEMLTSSIEVLRELGISGKPMLIVLNKVDLVQKEDVENKIAIVKKISENLYSPIEDIIPVSALKGINLNYLKEKLTHMVWA